MLVLDTMTFEELKKILDKEQKENILFMEKQFEHFEALTEKRMQLLRTLTNSKPSSIRALAIMVHRDVKNVFDDLQVLDHMKIIKLVRVGRCTRPVVRRKIIIFSLE
jgi:predicted transcriptional regulator